MQGIQRGVGVGECGEKGGNDDQKSISYLKVDNWIGLQCFSETSMKRCRNILPPVSEVTCWSQNPVRM